MDNCADWYLGFSSINIYMFGGLEVQTWNKPGLGLDPKNYL